MGTTKSNRLKRAEFGQRIVVVSWAVTIVWISLSFILAFLDKDTNSDVTIALITESFGVTIAYFAYQAVLKTNRNKHGIDSDGIPFVIKQKLTSIFEETDSDIDIDKIIEEVNETQNTEEGVG